MESGGNTEGYKVSVNCTGRKRQTEISFSVAAFSASTYKFNESSRQQEKLHEFAMPDEVSLQ